MTADWAQVGVSLLGAVAALVLGLAGLYFGHSLRRKTREEIDAQVAERRFDAYGALWGEMAVAAPSREEDGSGALRPDERVALHGRMTAWYYRKGNGMLLAEETRNIYLIAKSNLISPTEQLVPRSLADAVQQSKDPDGDRGRASMRQLSLLRTSMRGDIAIYTKPYKQALSAWDIEFLRECGVDVNRPPWRASRSPTEGVGSALRGDA